MSLQTAIYDRLVADATLASLLATYGGDPAVVIGDEDTLPEDLDPPFVQIAGPGYDEPNDTKTDDGREIEIVLRAYADATGSTLIADQIAERCRTLLHRQPSGLADGAYISRCSGPLVAPTDASLYGREITVRVTTLITPSSEEDS